MKTFDAVIIGAGQAGVPLAKKLAAAGWHTALVEKKYVGGTCVNTGCTPTKTLIASGQTAYVAAHAQKWGVEIDKYLIDMPAVKKRKDDIVINGRNGIEKNLKETENLELIYGTARFAGEKTLQLQYADGKTEEITADKIFINTGAKTAIPKIDGLDQVPYLTSDTIQDLESVPEHLLIVGAGYISLEFAQLYRRLGSEVTILENAGTFLAREDDDIANNIKDILEEDGINIILNAAAQSFSAEAKNIKAVVAVQGKNMDIVCSHLLIATGRPPQTDGLDLDKAGIKTGSHGEITVNEYLETNVAGVYALGDVKGGPAFTHVAYNDFVIAWKNQLHNAGMSAKDRPVLYCMYTDPQLGRIGISEKQAKEQGLKIKIASMPMTAVARAHEAGYTRGMMKAVIDADSGKILGVAVLGMEGGELMTVLQMAMEGGITYDRLRYMMFAHPSLSESINNLFARVDD